MQYSDEDEWDDSDEGCDVREALYKAQMKYAEQEVSKTAEEIEELHENLVELDCRFERSERINQEVRKELEEKIAQLEEKLKKSVAEVTNCTSECDRLKCEVKEMKKDFEEKVQFVRKSLRGCIENTTQEVSEHLHGNRNNGSFSRSIMCGSVGDRSETKGKSRQVLQNVEAELKSILKSIDNL